MGTQAVEQLDTCATGDLSLSLPLTERTRWKVSGASFCRSSMASAPLPAVLTVKKVQTKRFPPGAAMTGVRPGVNAGPALPTPRPRWHHAVLTPIAAAPQHSGDYGSRGVVVVHNEHVHVLGPQTPQHGGLLQGMMCGETGHGAKKHGAGHLSPRHYHRAKEEWTCITIYSRKHTILEGIGGAGRPQKCGWWILFFFRIYRGAGASPAFFRSWASTNPCLSTTIWCHSVDKAYFITKTLNLDLWMSTCKPCVSMACRAVPLAPQFGRYARQFLGVCGRRVV